VRIVITVDYMGESHEVLEERPFTIGREGDLVLDATNPFLHRVFLTIEHRDGLWWLDNVGSRLAATVSARASGMEAWLSPGGRLPLVFPGVVVWATAGDTTYDFEILSTSSPFRGVAVDAVVKTGEHTIGAVGLTPDQRLLITALAENVLRNLDRGAGSVPTSKEAATRLGWPITKFNRKLDNVCSKLEKLGVAGLHGGPTNLAVSRKARLVEYAVGAGIITRHDLSLLPPDTTPVDPGPPEPWAEDMAPTPWLRAG